MDIPTSYRIPLYLVASRTITNATERIADRNINNRLVNLKVFCVMKLALPGRLIPLAGLDHPAIVACYSLAVTSVTTPAVLVFHLKELARGLGRIYIGLNEKRRKRNIFISTEPIKFLQYVFVRIDS